MRQFSSMIPVSGSAYTYAYASLVKFCLGYWLGTYSGICCIEHGSCYFLVRIFHLLCFQGFGIKWPDWLAIDAGSASRAYEQVLHAKVGEHLPSNIIAAAKTYENSSC